MSTDLPAESAADTLRQYLAGNDVPCPQCEYNLRDLIGNRCPECGEPLVLRVNLSEPRQRWLITGLIGLSAGAGLNGLLLLYVVVQFGVRPGQATSGMGQFITINTIGVVAMGAFMAAYLRAWRKIRRLPMLMRATIAVLCWVLAVADLVIFAVKIR